MIIFVERHLSGNIDMEIINFFMTLYTDVF
jgi:hypothetical protein